MEFKDKFGNEIKCTVEEYKELTKVPKLVFQSTATITSGVNVTQSTATITSGVNVTNRPKHYKKHKKHNNIDGRSIRMKAIHDHVNKLRRSNPYLNYNVAFSRANHAWNKKHGGK